MKGASPLEVHSIFYRNPHYHEDSDTADLLDDERMAQLTSALYEMLRTLER